MELLNILIKPGKNFVDAENDGLKQPGQEFYNYLNRSFTQRE